MIIPLNIVTYYHDLNNYPENMKNNYYQLVDSHPGFNCNIYDNVSAYDFIINHFDSDVGDAFLKLKPYSYKSDLFRFCYIYVTGGIYVDIKYQCVNNFKFNQLIDK
jgi:mannosyltransferase OCH1-like enzyme